MFGFLIIVIIFLGENGYFNSFVLAQNVTNSSPNQQSPLSPSLSFLSSQTTILPPHTSFYQSSFIQVASSASKTCTIDSSLVKVEENTPQQIEGPYFVKGMPNRLDIRSDSSDGSIQQGIPLHLVLHVYKVNGKNNNSSNTNTNTNTDTDICSPLSGARVDIWHTNSQGIYSDIQQLGIQGKTYLRGYQITDKNGTATFDTIYPGWYPGRAIHIHVKVSTFQGPIEKYEWISQFYFDNSINDQVHKQLPYSKHGSPPLKNEDDGIFTGSSTDGSVKINSGKQLMLNLTKDKDGYIGTFNIVLNALYNFK